MDIFTVVDCCNQNIKFVVSEISVKIRYTLCNSLKYITRFCGHLLYYY